MDEFPENISENPDRQPDKRLDIAIANLVRCTEAMMIENHIVSCLQKDLFAKNNALFDLEDKLLALCSQNDLNVLDGVFYCCLLHVREVNCFVLRYFEWGSLAGFKNKVIADREASLKTEIFEYKVYTHEDVNMSKSRSAELQQTKNPNEGKTQKNYHAFDRIVFKNKNSIDAKIKELTQTFSSVTSGELSQFICCVYRKDLKYAGDDRYKPYIITYPPESSNEWKEKLRTYRANPCLQAGEATIFDDVSSNSFSLQHQFICLSRIPNFHKWSWGKIIKDMKFEQKLSTSCRRYPGSPSRIIQAYCYRDDWENIFRSCLRVLNGENITVYPSSSNAQKSNASKSKRPKLLNDEKKNIQQFISESDSESDYTSEAMETREDDDTVEAQAPVNDHGDNELSGSNEACNTDVSFQTFNVGNQKTVHSVLQLSLRRCDNSDLTLYEYYYTEILRRGELKWREMSGDEHVVLMNDYNCENGNFMENDFIHVRAKKAGNSLNIKCDCKVYHTLLVSSECEQILCCHTRLLEDLLLFIEGRLENQSLRSVLTSERLQTALLFAEQSILKLPCRGNSEKFSIRSKESVEFVSMFTVPNTARRVVKCHSSMCILRQGSSRSFDTLDEANVCGHLAALRNDITDNVEINELEDLTEGIENFEEMDCRREKWEDDFDAEKGEWNFTKNSPSQMTVSSDPFNEKLIVDVAARDSYNVNDDILFTPIMKTGPCDCESEWADCCEISENSILFTNKKSFNVSVCCQKCKAGVCSNQWDGVEDSIFRLSTATCAGYEIGWEFVDLVKTSKQTFRGFVSYYTNKYKRNGSTNTFMSHQTFIEWFFGWSSRMKLEFRRGCHWCGDSPRILACDGTKLGIIFKNTFVTPIEKPEVNVSDTDSNLRRYDRCFFRNIKGMEPSECSSLRRKVQTLCEEIINGSIVNTNMDELNKLESFFPLQSRDVFFALFDSSLTSRTRVTLARVFKLLSFDASLDTIIPFRICNEIKESVLSNTEENDCDVARHIMEGYCPEISELLFQVRNNQLLRTNVMKMIIFCADTVIENHQHDFLPEEADPIPGTYNPPKYGAAYYFTSHGCQLRKTRSFKADTKHQSINFDDVSEAFCQKRYPNVSKKGTSYLFLWFCPMHGHCYGYHIIPGSEGRKDVATSLYKYCEVPPAEVMYDFACSLSEYVKNRESGFFSQTRFFHDVFHGFSHKCSPGFRSSRIRSFDCVKDSV